MNKKEIREVLKTLSEKRNGTINVFINSAIMLRAIPHMSRFNVYKNERGEYVLHLITIDGFPMATVMEHNIDTISIDYM